jgi:Sulfotransferase family
MLSCALARQHKVSRPRYASGKHSDDILGNPRRPPAKPGIPRIVSSHTVPSIICRWAWLTRALPHPPVVVLVRDIRAAMASHYLKWRDCTEVTFSSYVRGDPSGRRYGADIWWYIRFFNRWGDLVQANPKKILVVRYEDLQAHPEVWLREIAAHWGLDLDDEAFGEALRFSSRDAIRSQLDPSRTEIVVPPKPATTYLEYWPGDEAFIHRTITRYLRHDFGYGYIKYAELRGERPSARSRFGSRGRT